MTPADFGQHDQSITKPSISLVSFFSAPVAVRRTQVYVVFVTDAALAGTIDGFDWTFTNGGTTALTTDIGMAEFTPQSLGTLGVSVRVKNGATQVAALTLLQAVKPLNGELELLIDQQETSTPKAAHPETSREAINDMRGYVNQLLPPQSDDAFNKLLSSLAYNHGLESLQLRRHLFLERLAKLINDGKHKDFGAVAKGGFGACKTRPHLAAMLLNKPSGTAPFIPVQELPADKKKQAKVQKAIEKDFDALTESDKIDLFNVLRFPKSHLKVARLILEGLAARDFSGTAMSDVLKDGKKAGRLLNQFEDGPLEKPKAGGFETKTVELTGHKLWTIPVPKVGPGAGGGGASPPGPVGIPEKVPDITFIAANSPGDNNFIPQAVIYHDTYTLAPQTATSFEKMVETLAQSSAAIGRLRIVSHFFFDPKTVGSQVMIPFFEGQKTSSGRPFGATDIYDFEFGTSDDAGLLAYFKAEVIAPNKPGELSDRFEDFSNASGAKAKTHVVLFKALQKKTHAALAPFGLQSKSPKGAALTLVMAAADLFMLDHIDISVDGLFPTVTARAVGAPIVAAYKAHFAALIDKMKGAAPMTDTNVTNLKNAFIGLTFADMPVPRTNNYGYTVTLSGSYLQNHDVYRTNLNVVRKRLRNAAVDVRGCRVGGDKNYLKALRKFFGEPGKEPTVSGPTWFQAFHVPGDADSADESEHDRLFDNGFGVAGGGTKVTGASVQRAYSDWSGMIGLNAQLGFWAGLFAGDPFAFLATKAWVPRLPGLGMKPKKLDGIELLGFRDLVTLIREIFDIPAATHPTDSEVVGLASKLSQVEPLRLSIDAVDALPPTASQTALQAERDKLRDIAQLIGETLPAAPSPLDIAHLKTCIDQLRQSLLTSSKIATLQAALKAKSDDKHFGIRYMMNVGLPLMVQNGDDEDRFFVMYHKPQREEALKSLMRVHWESPLPTAMATAIKNLNTAPAGTTDANGTPTNGAAKAMQLSLLTEKSVGKTAATINPENEFAATIVREP